MLTWLDNDGVKPYVTLLYRVVVSLVLLFIIVRFVPVLLSFFLPFVLAFATASALNPLISFLQKKLGAPRRFLSALTVILAVLAVIAAVGAFLYTLIREIVALAQGIDAVLDYVNHTVMVISYHLYWMLDYLPGDIEDFFSGLLSSIMEGFLLWLQSQGTAFADAVVFHTVNVTTRVGGGVVSVVIFVMATIFMMSDYPKLLRRIKSTLGSKFYQSYITLKDVTLKALGSYIKAQLVLAFIAFGFSLIAFLVVGQEFALLLAFLIGVIDFVPLLGAAVILVPWGIVSIIAGEVGRGVYFLIMALVAFLLRRILEPKIVGNQMGLSPLMALVSIYIGMQLGGVIGLVLGPIVAMVLVSLHKAGVFNGWVHDINAVLNLHKRR